MAKCPTCQSCKRWYTLENNQYLVCFLCRRVWKLHGKIAVEVFEGELDSVGNNILDRFNELVDRIGVW